MVQHEAKPLAVAGTVVVAVAIVTGIISQGTLITTVMAVATVVVQAATSPDGEVAVADWRGKTISPLCLDAIILCR